MKNRQNQLPYAQGGYPGTLVIFTCVEAVISVIFCAAALISMISEQTVLSAVSVLVTGSMTVNTILTVLLYRGLRTLYHGGRGGAVLAAKACKGRRIVLWLTYLLEVLISVVTLVISRGFGFVIYLVKDLILLLVLLPFHFYYKDAEKILRCAANEENGQPVQSAKAGHFSALCISFAVLLGLAMVLFAANALNVISALRETFYYLPAYMIRMIFVVLYFSAVRFLVIHKCYRGFLDAHKGNDGRGTPHRPRISVIPTVCVLASILFGMMFALKASLLPDFIRYFPYCDLDEKLEQLVLMGAYFLLSIAAVCRPGRLSRTVTAAAGSALMAGYYLRAVIQPIAIRGIFLDFDSVLMFVINALHTGFYALVLMTAIAGRSGKKASDRTAAMLRGLAIAFTAAGLFLTVASRIRAGYFPMDKIIDDVFRYAMSMTAMLGLARTFTVTAEDGAVPAAWGTECEAAALTGVRKPVVKPAAPVFTKERPGNAAAFRMTGSRLGNPLNAQEY